MTKDTARPWSGRIRQDDGVTDRDAVPLDLASMRKQYRSEGLSAADLAATPVEQFARWFRQAATEGGLFEPNAMIVSTADGQGRPSSRTVLLKHFDDDGFVFYTNYDSRKGRDLAANPHVALLFPGIRWPGRSSSPAPRGAPAATRRPRTSAPARTAPSSAPGPAGSPR
ncbi:hypothetical protein SHKM778_88510 [Streptomyces sp. KM77-8]|uniref:Pyridoxamine 5'-phosphate oxidase N-terminal domain-containing protein n=1 Tax=Streptomyces haneummycinicus TaxID=3074435 RepID=A0AAT9HYJ5_9ACTN